MREREIVKHLSPPVYIGYLEKVFRFKGVKWCCEQGRIPSVDPLIRAGCKAKGWEMLAAVTEV